MADYGLVAAADPDQARAMRLEWLRDFQALPEARDAPLRAFVTKEHDAAQVVGYNKAAFLFHMLEQRAGSAGFDAAIRRFWRSNQDSSATWGDLEAAFSDVLGVDLSRFFEEWVERAGTPRLRLLQATAKEVDQGYQVSLQIRQDEPAYELRLPIAIETDQGVRRLEAAIDSLEAEVTLVTEARPLAVTVDPDDDVFRYLAPSEAPPILRDVTLSEHGLVVIPSGSQEFQRLADELAGRMMDGQAEVVPQDDPRIGTAPLLVIGPTDEVRNWLQRSALPPTPEQLIGRGDARVWTMRRDDASAILVVEADDAASLRALLRPLPHYGRSSYLIFEGAELIEQGVWPPGENPLRQLLGGRP
jgi:aminopeptidase N